MDFKYINLKYLQNFTQGDIQQMRKVITIFLDNAPSLLKQMMEGLDNEDFNQLKTAVHTLKSQVIYMGMDTIRPTILEVEELAKTANKNAEMKQGVTAIFEYINKGIEELNQI